MLAHNGARACIAPRLFHAQSSGINEPNLDQGVIVLVVGEDASEDLEALVSVRLGLAAEVVQQREEVLPTNVGGGRRGQGSGSDGVIHRREIHFFLGEL